MTIACATSWEVDRGDKWIPISAGRAAELSTAGFQVRLVSDEDSTPKPSKRMEYAIEYGADGLACAMHWIDRRPQ